MTLHNQIKQNLEIKYWLSLLIVLIFSCLLTACQQAPSFSASTVNDPLSLNDQSIRKPAIGQQWVYDVRNLYNNEVIDTITETVDSITPFIEIKRESKKYGSLAPEIQSSLGMVIQDPYWNPTVKFVNPLPLWPQSKNRSQTFTTQYKASDSTSLQFWSSNVTLDSAEVVHLRGDQYNTIKISDAIQFVSEDFSKKNSLREATIWYAPSIGRWVIKRTNGSYLDINSGRGNDRYESMLQYELVSYK